MFDRDGRSVQRNGVRGFAHRRRWTAHLSNSFNRVIASTPRPDARSDLRS
jgi:hypothetical protein